jgi:hypothetical protein
MKQVTPQIMEELTQQSHISQVRSKNEGSDWIVLFYIVGKGAKESSDEHRKSSRIPRPSGHTKVTKSSRVIKASRPSSNGSVPRPSTKHAILSK